MTLWAFFINVAIQLGFVITNMILYEYAGYNMKVILLTFGLYCISIIQIEMSPITNPYVY